LVLWLCLGRLGLGLVLLGRRLLGNFLDVGHGFSFAYAAIFDGL
jgi:hypothetical protein